MEAEQVFRYPRTIRWPIELLTGLGVLFAALLLGRDVLRLFWQTFGTGTTVSNVVPFWPELVRTIRGPETADVLTLASLLPSLGWLALALLLALLLRNSLPTVRTSARGVLVEFAGDWLPIPWETLKSIKVTEDLGAEHFVLLAETDRKALTGWHRFYSFAYGFGFRPGFLITSWISNFDGLVKTLLSETDRIAHVLENVKPAQLQEGSSSPLFRFILGPASFFSRRTQTDAVLDARPVSESRPNVAAPTAPAQSSKRGIYPRRISNLLSYGSTLLIVILLVRYAIYWLEFLALTFPQFLNQPVFNRLQLLQGQQAAPWWHLVAAHIVALLVLAVAVAMRNLLPELEARNDGLAARYFNRWRVIPWSRITAVKVTEFSEESQILLIQTAGGLPFSTRLSSLLYDGSLRPGILLTAAISTFEPLMQRIILEITRLKNVESPADIEMFQSEAASPLLLGSLRPANTIDQRVEQSRADRDGGVLERARVLQAAAPMVCLALMPALLLFANQVLRYALLPTPGLLGGVLVLFVLSLLEWPLVSLGAASLDDATGGGEEGNRPLYLYPITQLPRVLPMAGALLAVLLGIPVLPTLLWLGAIAWSFLLASGLWSELFDWKGSLLAAGGLMPVVFQLLILLAYLLAF